MLRGPQDSVRVPQEGEARNLAILGQRQVGLGDVRAELYTLPGVHDLEDPIRLDDATVRPGCAQSRHRIGDPEDLRTQRDLGARESIGVSATVPPLVVVPDQDPQRLEVRDFPDAPLRSLRVASNARPHLIRKLGCRVLPGVFGQTDHAHVRQDRREHQLGAFLLAQAQLGAEPGREHGDPGPVIAQVSLRRAHDPRERF